MKRIAAAGGDVVECKGQQLTVPEECFYMLGDNKGNSIDSRIWEEPCVEECDIIAVLPGKGYAQGRCDGYFLRF